MEQGGSALRVAYLGPRGTFTEDALIRAAGDRAVKALPAPSVYAAILAVESGEADRALVPFENSIEGAVRTTLDTLAFDASGVVIVGEYDLPIRHCLIAREELPLERIEVVLSHPQATAQCARFIRESLPAAEVRAASSTAEAVRQVSESDRPWAALGTESAAVLYGAAVLRDGVEDEPDNVTRFVWVAPEGTVPEGEGPWRTTLVFAELGEDKPGALVEALGAFSDRGVNLTRIESRPRRRGLGRYMFFLDCEGSLEDPTVADAIADLRTKAESVRVLGSYPTG
ncbi:MAG TPA: prephenate dehydratase [Solirubrobacterales bacterium]|jgi:prephenate dehydratase|nr:prephenate dehydratase [Solirubrobacterales bacterium]